MAGGAPWQAVRANHGILKTLLGPAARFRSLQKKCSPRLEQCAQVCLANLPYLMPLVILHDICQRSTHSNVQNHCPVAPEQGSQS